MRIKGKIISWDSEKGFGFAKSDSDGSDIFLHISSFGNRNRIPQIGEQVSYIATKGKQGRPCGESACMAGDLPVKKIKKKSEVSSFFVATSFFSAIGLSVYLGKLPFTILVIYIAVSLITFTAYALDKSAAKKGRWRTKEKTLHLLSLFGGWPGAMIAQQKLRHKSWKQNFRHIFWVTVLLNIGVLVWFHTPEGANTLQFAILQLNNLIDVFR